MTHTLRLVRTVAILVLGVTRFAAAQTTGTLSGSIVDSSGAVLPGVQITVRQLSTGFTRSTITAADGRFVVAGISAGPVRGSRRAVGVPAGDAGRHRRDRR